MCETSWVEGRSLSVRPSVRPHAFLWSACALAGARASRGRRWKRQRDPRPSRARAGLRSSSARPLRRARRSRCSPAEAPRPSRCRVAHRRPCARRARARPRRCAARSPLPGSIARHGSSSRACVALDRVGRALDRVVDRRRPVVGAAQPRARAPRLSHARAAASARFRGGVRGARARLWRACSAPRSAGRCSGSSIPSLAEDGDRIARLREPVGYWNALALLADVGLALGLWLAHRAASHRCACGRRASSSSARVVVLLLTQSRAGVARGGRRRSPSCSSAAPRRLEAALLGLVCGRARALAVAALGVHPSGARRGRCRACRSRRRRPALRASRSSSVPRSPSRRRCSCPSSALWSSGTRRVAAPALLAAAAALLALVGAAGAGRERRQPVLVGGATRSSGGECTNDPGRLTELCDNNRLAWWGDALADRPRPSGRAGPARAPSRSPGSAFVTTRRRSPSRTASRSSCSPISASSDSRSACSRRRAAVARRPVPRCGGSTARAARTPPRSPRSRSRGSLHALVDYDLDFVAVTGPALLATGALLAAGRPLRRLSRRPSRAARRSPRSPLAAVGLARSPGARAARRSTGLRALRI